MLFRPAYRGETELLVRRDLAENLGALGDGGAILTRDAALAARVKRLRNGGQTTRYRHDEFGVNSRLDEMQAAILRARLKHLPAWTAKRRAQCG